MPFCIVAEEGRQRVNLTGSLTGQHAHDLAAMLGGILEPGVTVSVTTTDLEDIDTCILQLLCSLRKSIPQFSFDKPSEALTNAVDRCCLRRDLLGSRETS